MPSGFFHSSTLRTSKAPESTLPKCGACALFKKCNTPKMPVSGEGRLGILVVGESAEVADDDEGTHFEGEHGDIVRDVFADYDVDLDRDCWMTYSVICRPSNAKPSPEQIEYCRPNLMNTIRELNPTVIILLGSASVQSLMGQIWGSNVGPIQRWVGWTIPYQNWNTWICPVYSPYFVKRSEDMKRPDRVPRLFFKKHIKKAIQLADSRPWDEVPDYSKAIDLIFDQDEACRLIDKLIDMKPGLVAFDYEANMLKPDSPDFKLYSCSICFNGKKTIAFPWSKKVAKSMRRLLRSKHGMIASNLKYEDRVTRACLDTRVRNWHWDTMIAAHAIHNIPGTKSVKFQAFVLLGFPPYNEHIEPLLRTDSKCGYDINQIEEISAQDLLIYNGVDSLVEYLVYEKQKEIFNASK